MYGMIIVCFCCNSLALIYFTANAEFQHVEQTKEWRKISNWPWRDKCLEVWNHLTIWSSSF